MTNLKFSIEEWLYREDAVEREARLTRLKWLISRMPPEDYFVIPSGGQILHYLFEETKYCFVYGQFLSTIIIGASCIEHVLAALFYMTGRNDLERASIYDLLNEALNSKIITQSEYDKIEKARQIRNSIIHFRKLLDNNTIERYSVIQEEHPYIIIEENSRYVMELVIGLFAKLNLNR